MNRYFVVNLYFHRTRKRNIISLTPLIDVVFILLLFFMLASQFTVDNGLAVRARSADAVPHTSDQPAGRLQVVDDDTVSLDGELLDKSAFTEAVMQRLQLNPSYALAVSVASGARVQALLEIIALVGQLGVARVSIEAPVP